MVRVVNLMVVVTVLALPACGATRVGQASGEPVPDPAGFVAMLRETTVSAGPTQITFQWTLDEAGSRVRGRGVVRVEAPHRIRLDLFGPRDETYLVAALVDGEYRFPTADPPPVQLPSPSLLWGALGVLEPPPSAPLLGATADSASADVRFGVVGGEVFVYTFESTTGGEFRLERLERAGPRGVIETVTVERGAAAGVSTTRYRDWSAFRDLVLEIENSRVVASFPANIWRPGAETP